ncbi:phage tail tube protein [Streptomyces sp. NPDC002067]
MALLDAAAIVAAGGYIFIADPDTEKPGDLTDPTNPGGAWENIGHTALDELPEFGRDGDDPEIKGSWQNAKLRATTPDVTYSLTFKSIQATALTYGLYFGAGPGAVQADDSFRIPATPVPQTKALLVVLVDGQRYLPLWHPRVSLLGSDAVGMSATDFMTFPLKATLLGSSLIGNAVGEWAQVMAPKPPPPPSGE